MELRSEVIRPCQQLQCLVLTSTAKASLSPTKRLQKMAARWLRFRHLLLMDLASSSICVLICAHGHTEDEGIAGEEAVRGGNRKRCMSSGMGQVDTSPCARLPGQCVRRPSVLLATSQANVLSYAASANAPMAPERLRAHQGCVSPALSDCTTYRRGCR